MAIKIGILGYGNLARGVEAAIKQNNDLQLEAVFTRRDPSAIQIQTEGVSVYSIDDAVKFKDRIDVMIMAGGSATDLPKQTPDFAQYFNVVDSFDTHAHIPEHFHNTDLQSKKANKISIISIGWDPGVFSLVRMISSAVLPEGNHYTFWGKGVSQGHSDAIRRIDGVLDARQYTVPSEESLNKARAGKNIEFTARQMHTRECYVVVKDNVDKALIEKQIKEMPDYFADYDTTVHFISQQELNEKHSGLPHGGFVLRTGVTGNHKEYNNVIEYSLKLDSNPAFTGSVLVAYARAAYRLNKEGQSGCKTIFDIAPAYLSSLSEEELRSHLL